MCGYKIDVITQGSDIMLRCSGCLCEVQHQLLLSELSLAVALLRPGGSFVAKVFRGENIGADFDLKILIDPQKRTLRSLRFEDF